MTPNSVTSSTAPERAPGTRPTQARGAGQPAGGSAPQAAAPPASAGRATVRDRQVAERQTHSLASLYHASERGMNGTFPLGAQGLFHSGAHLVVEAAPPICAIARGEVVAARIGVGAGEHPWGDTGFVPRCGIRSKVESPSTPSSCTCRRNRCTRPHQGGLVRRLLIARLTAQSKAEWRIMEAVRDVTRPALCGRGGSGSFCRCRKME